MADKQTAHEIREGLNVMCDDGWGYDARALVDEILAIKELSPPRRAILLTVVLAGDEFVAELGRKTRTEYWRLVEEHDLPGPRSRGAGRPEKIATSELGAAARQRARLAAESAWRPSRAS